MGPGGIEGRGHEVATEGWDVGGGKRIVQTKAEGKLVLSSPLAEISG